MHKRFIRKTIACLLAGILAAAVPGEIILTEQVYGAEDPLDYDEVSADELPEDEVPADEVRANEIRTDEALGE